MKINFRKILLLLVVFTPLTSLVVWAASDTFTVTTTLRQAVNITPVPGGGTTLSFGIVEIPASGSSSTVIVADGSAQQNGGQSAEWSITGETGQVGNASVVTPMTITANGSTVDIVLALSSAALSFSGSALPLYLGGTLTVDSTDNSGAYTDTTVVLTVIY